MNDKPGVPHPYHANIQILIPSDVIHQRLTTLVDEIVGKLAEKQIVIIGLMRGSFMFISDLARMFYYHQVAAELDFMSISSYEGERSSGRVRILKDIGMNIANRDVLLVDDILDTGLTMAHATRSLLRRRPQTLTTCVLLDKRVKRAVAFSPDYVGFRIQDRYVVGYGLDYNNRYRELPFIGVLTRPGRTQP